MYHHGNLAGTNILSHYLLNNHFDNALEQTATKIQNNLLIMRNKDIYLNYL